ncbi:two-component system, chemotaxis family, response regulator CheY [Salinibacillus kushneri]|uniref:Two-component system, chemotaxis family, response regulator CheY n=1 Tax=Salinibacillus kushneri TaxID=237682 RepID=A0A1I0ETE6_9BACI|nr:response regulator [Salinibacillus kushneri]SET48376.1 two-component system, chemotaxis family, response regulator CheY [Salinibacillus kushneri]
MSIILLADDSAFMRNWLKQILKQYGYYETVEARDGQEAIDTYKSIHPDMVIMDTVMPKITGLEALAEIMRFDSKANVIMCSSLSTETNVMKAIQLGAKDFVVKPYFKNLGETVNKHLSPVGKAY